MTPIIPGETSERSHAERAGLAILGIAFVLAGLGLFYGLAVDSMQIFNAALIAIFVLLAVSMGILVRSEPIRSQENAVISICVFVAMALYLGLSIVTALPFAVLFGVLVIVGVIVPGLVLQYGLTNAK
ncbi:hypothetical protein [Halostagnicola sp. A-GB9-2]|uniref:hypothetical protein n=1 Tax=Halostagnicola sp. A-GB9-2 TaxID=3048066 RepID=UPI0024C005F2|nr:hypothetical protein [Halostagnicola sp. A-GB9-2]MDJ1433041.1 hypothetical protein [Halostagnicola sp. A-GB9-2]